MPPVPTCSGEQAAIASGRRVIARPSAWRPPKPSAVSWRADCRRPRRPAEIRQPPQRAARWLAAYPVAGRIDGPDIRLQGGELERVAGQHDQVRALARHDRAGLIAEPQ